MRKPWAWRLLRTLGIAGTETPSFRNRTTAGRSNPVNEGSTPSEGANHKCWDTRKACLCTAVNEGWCCRSLVIACCAESMSLGGDHGPNCHTWSPYG